MSKRRPIHPLCVCFSFLSRDFLLSFFNIVLMSSQAALRVCGRKRKQASSRQSTHACLHACVYNTSLNSQGVRCASSLELISPAGSSGFAECAPTHLSRLAKAHIDIIGLCRCVFFFNGNWMWQLKIQPCDCTVWW